MTHAPAILSEGRSGFFAAIVLTGVGEAVIIGFAAFAMRDLFAALHLGSAAPLGALATLGLCALLVALLRLAGRTVSERLGQHYAVSVRRRLYLHLAGQPLAQLSGRRDGALALRFVGDLGALRGWAGKGLARLFTAVLVMPGAALTLWLINTALAQAVVLPLTALFLIMLVGAVVLAPVHRDLRSRRARIAIEMIERARLAPILDRMRRTRKEVKALDRNGADLTELATRRVRRQSLLRNLPEVGLALAAISLMSVAFDRDVAPAEVAAALAILSILIVPLRDLADVWDCYTAWRVARAKLEAVLDQPSAGRRPSKHDGGVAIRFEQVRFRGVTADLDIAAGETVVVTGTPGSGKSSLLRLAAGLEEPERGVVLFNDGQMSPRAVLVGADAPILQGSLRRALCLGAVERPDDEQVEAVARAFGLGPLIERIGGLSGRVGEAGRTLSAGEAVRIHLAHARLACPNVVIVDSPLLELDSELVAALKSVRVATAATLLVASASGAGLDPDGRVLVISNGKLSDKTAASEADAAHCGQVWRVA